MKYKLTIIIPTFNSCIYLKEFLNSLTKQNFKSYQIFIADGGSKDNTLQIINEFFKSRVRIISRQDNSFENGVNKCLKKINSKYFCILGSDDVLGNSKYLSNLIKILDTKKIDIVFPQFGVIENNKKRKVIQSNYFNYIKYKTVLPGIGWIAKSEIIKNNYFNENIKVASDYDLLLRLFKKKNFFYRNNNSIYYFRIGTGTSYKKVYRGFFEQMIVALINKGPVIKILYVFFNSFIKFFLKDVYSKSKVIFK